MRNSRALALVSFDPLLTSASFCLRVWAIFRRVLKLSLELAARLTDQPR